MRARKVVIFGSWAWVSLHDLFLLLLSVLIVMSVPVSLIFGATGGIGSQTARMLRQRGHLLALSSRSLPRLRHLNEQLSATGSDLSHEPELLPCDATDAAAVDEVFAKAVERFGRVDRVAHCVGSILLRPLHATTDEQFRDTWKMNTWTAFLVLRAACKQMARQKGSANGERGGSVVLCSSAVASHGLPQHEAVAAAKAGVEGMARSAAASYAPQNIRVNCIAPGLTDTPMAKFITDKPAAKRASEGMHALGRIGQPEEVATALVFLLENPFITGQTLAVDGGLSSLLSQQRA